MELEEIKQTIQKGLTKGYNQNLLLLNPYEDLIDQVREYLLTVNVAQQLLEWNQNYTHKIQIEYPVSHFCNNAFSAYEWDGKDLFSMGIIHRQPGHSPTNTLHQKIDIVITQILTGGNSSSHERSLSGIELKAINKSSEEIIQDTKRMCNAMLNVDTVSQNSIEFCFCGFLRRFDRNTEIVTDDFIKQKTANELNRWNTICTGLAGNYPTLNFTIEMFDIINRPVEMVAGIHKVMESDYAEVAMDTGIVVGYILTITRKLQVATDDIK